MPLREKYIGAGTFGFLNQTDRGYEGFVEGLGYAYTKTEIMNPPNQRAFGWDREIQYRTRNELVKFQYLDTSPEMVARSLANLPKNPVHHIVVSGDTLSALAMKYGVSVENLVKWNGMSNKNQVIRTGDKLVVGTKISETDFINVIAEINSAIAMAGVTASTIAGLKYTRNIVGTNFGGFWRGVNQQYYGSAQAQRSSGRGWNFREDSMNKARGAQPYRGLRAGGRVLGAATIGLSLGSFIDSPNWRDGIDVVGGVGGLIYWPIGVAHIYYTVLVPIMWQSIREHHIERARQVSEGNMGNAMMMSRTMRR